MTRQKIGIAVIGFGWMGQAHTRSYLRIPTLFQERTYDPELIIISDNVQERVDEAVESFGFREGTTDWQAAIDHPRRRRPFASARRTCSTSRSLSQLPRPASTCFVRSPLVVRPSRPSGSKLRAARLASITGVGYNYRWAPLVQYAKNLIADGTLGEITNYNGRFFTMYGSDPMGLLSWRFQLDGAGHGVSSDILSHSIDLAHMLVGPIKKVVGAGHTYIPDRPLPKAGGTHYDAGQPGDPTGPVENEDYFGALVQFESGARGTFEASRTVVGPESQCAFEIYGTKGSLKWNLETMNELQLNLVGAKARGYTTVYAGDRYPYHGHFVPGDANSIGYEDLKVIEDFEFLSSVAAGRQTHPWLQ